MSHVYNEVMVANRRYAENVGKRALLPMPPARQSAILTCMDARLDPARFAGLAEDVRRLRNHPLVPAEIPIYGMIYDVHSGRLPEVSEAAAIGAPMQQAWSRAA